MTKIRKEAVSRIEDEKSKAEQYQKKFDDLIKEVDAEMPFDPVISEQVETLNK
jgi:chromosome segregation ATPase